MSTSEHEAANRIRAKEWLDGSAATAASARLVRAW